MKLIIHQTYVVRLTAATVFHSHVSHFSQTKAKRTKKKGSAFCLQPQGSHLFCSPDMCFTNNYRHHIWIPEQPQHEPEGWKLLPIFLFERLFHWFLGFPQRIETMSTLALSNLVSICKSTCVSVQVTYTTANSSHSRLTFYEMLPNWLLFLAEGKKSLVLLD